ncbi:MAG: hypothetical protein OEX17_02460 [Rhodospirillaceae bacterium]|nr:hypothetical protein [Rhodospirillaceae bacterium]
MGSKNQAAPFFLRGRLLHNRQVSGGTAGSRILWQMALFAKSALSNYKPHIQTKKPSFGKALTILPAQMTKESQRVRMQYGAFLSIF